MLGSKLQYMGMYKGKKLWESTGLPFNHPTTGEQIEVVYTDAGSMLVSPEKAADIREEATEKLDPNKRYRVYPVVTPDKI